MWPSKFQSWQWFRTSLLCHWRGTVPMDHTARGYKYNAQYTFECWRPKAEEAVRQRKKV